jgi:hypothetical protein
VVHGRLPLPWCFRPFAVSGGARSVLPAAKGDIAYYHSLYRCGLAFSQSILPAYAKRRESRIYRFVSASWSSIGNSVKSHHYVVKPSSPSVLALFWVAAIPARPLPQATPLFFPHQPVVQAPSPLSLAAGRDLVCPRLDLFQLGGKR